MTHRTARRISWLALFSTALAFGCRRGAPATQIARMEAGALPQGCTTAGRADLLALGPAVDILRSGLESALKGTALPTLDAHNGVRRASFCKLAKGTSARTDFILVLGGEVRPDALAALAASDGSEPTSSIEGTPVVARGGLWVARRTARDGSSEVILASDLDRMRVALVGPAGSYALDESAALAITIDAGDLPSRSGRNGPAGGNGLDAVRAVNISVLAGAAGLVGRFSIGEQVAAERLARDLRPLIAGLANRLGIATHTSPRVLTEVERGDVVARIELPPGTLEMLASSLASLRARSTLPR